MSTAQPIAIDVWSDIACPWCYVGKRRLEQALERYAAIENAPPVAVTYHSFQLAPETPAEYDGDQVDYLSRRKGIPADDARRMMGQVAQVAAQEGLDYDMDAVQVTNTADAHRLLHLARGRGLQAQMKERLLAAYFIEGRHVGRVEELADLAAEVGLDRAEVLDALSDPDHHADDVQADIEQARRYGIGGVPFFVFDQRYGLSGAQPVEAFLEALTRTVADRDEASA